MSGDDEIFYISGTIYRINGRNYLNKLDGMNMTLY